MNSLPIADLTTIKNGYAFRSKDYASSGYRVIRIANVQKGKIVDNNPQFVPDNIANSYPEFILSENDLLMSLTGNVGRVGRVKKELLPAVLNQRVAALYPRETIIDLEYLFHYLNSDSFIKEAERNSNGIAQLNLSTKWVGQHKVPVPPMAEQKRIAAILDKADDIRRKREESLKLADEFLKSVFDDMFGDPFNNPKDWDVVRLKDVIEEGPQNGLYKPSKCYGKGNPIIRIDSFYNGIVNIEKLKTVEVNDKELDAFEIFEGDFVINRVNSRSHLGKCGLVPKIKNRTVFESNMMRVKFDKTQLDNEYALMILKSDYMKNQILNSAKDAVNQSSINQKDVTSFQIPLPPIHKQLEFAAIVQQIGKQTREMEKSLNFGREVVGSLTQKAFKGEL